ncbi:MAG TPA: TadE/TadG family type IV pilus assembly protein [Pseudorhodoplanes sp.]|nr:TadE/TadG family type IV pilus assembly protein [Pseudorhodoplanes sp.]
MLFARFWQNRDGGVAPFLAIAAVPLIGLTGAGIDYSRASAARTAMQSALDATALSLSKTAQGQTGEQIQGQAEQIFNAMFIRPEVENVSIQTNLSSPQQGSFVLNVSGSGTIKTYFAKVIGHSEMTFGSKSEVLWGIKKLNLALALDNTGSMSSSGKMTALKTASHNLIDTLKDAAKTPGDIKVSIVPFAVDVNAGTGNVAASWIDWEHWEAANGDCSKSSYHSKNSCNNNGGTWTPKDHSVWNGCVNDRDQNNDVMNTPAGSGASTKYRAHQASACPAAMMALSTDWSAMHTKIDAMTPSGNTNVTIGLQMAWQTLSNNEPFNAPAPSPDLDKVIILLTDGQNTQNRWTSSTSSIDDRTQKTCDNAKAANIRIYTVRVIDGNGTLLQNCATKPDMYYDVDQADELNGVFSSIAQNLANLRIAK